MKRPPRTGRIRVKVRLGHAAFALFGPLLASTLAGRSATELIGKAMSETSPYTSNVRINARFSPRDFVPDGDLTKKAWKRAEWVRFDHDMSGQRAYPEAATQVAACWTGAYVYSAFRCKYSTLNVYEGEDRRAAKTAAPIPSNHRLRFGMLISSLWRLERQPRLGPFRAAFRE